MALRPRTTLKSFFQTGDFPNQEQFWDLIDSCVNKTDDGAPLSFVPTPPSTPDDPGAEGNMAYDDDYLYLYTPSGKWKRTPLSEW